MLSVALYLFILALLASWGAVLVLSRGSDTLNNIVPVSAHAEHSLTESFFERVERVFGHAQHKVAETFYKFTYEALRRFVPWFRAWTRGTESHLQRLINTIKGKQTIDTSNRGNSSQFLKDIKSHAQDTGSGRIDE
ncbi:MAG TPA: hypothetical protein VJB98_03405 [Candidatus Paceibacterota bacterium]